ncbi:hypothetical protein Tco_1200599 [Tanacetum coccineum]
MEATVEVAAGWGDDDDGGDVVIMLMAAAAMRMDPMVAEEKETEPKSGWKRWGRRKILEREKYVFWGLG